MGKTVHNDVLDAAHNEVRDNATRITICSQEPTTFAEANATYMLAQQTVDSSDFSIADGDTSGRKLTLAAQNGVSVSSTGTGNHLAILDVANSKLLRTTTFTGQALTSGNTVDIGAHDYEIADPA